MRNAPLAQGILQRTRDMFLTDDFGKGLGTPLPSCNLIHDRLPLEGTASAARCPTPLAFDLIGLDHRGASKLS